MSSQEEANRSPYVQEFIPVGEGLIQQMIVIRARLAEVERTKQELMKKEDLLRARGLDIATKRAEKLMEVIVSNGINITKEILDTAKGSSKSKYGEWHKYTPKDSGLVVCVAQAHNTGQGEYDSAKWRQDPMIMLMIAGSDGLLVGVDEPDMLEGGKCRVAITPTTHNQRLILRYGVDTSGQSTGCIQKIENYGSDWKGVTPFFPLEGYFKVFLLEMDIASAQTVIDLMRVGELFPLESQTENH